ncbi:MAG TPA: UdgX family uracil-DNA binding protein [Bryobacteraceae bacterium]|nr:UdgX family uracil-DNA binding protein [Bryobacteraceae bacterium]
MDLVEDFGHWRNAARSLLSAEVHPDAVLWNGGLFSSALPAGTSQHIVPRAFLAMAEVVGCHRERSKWDVLYRVLWRLTHGEPHLLEVHADPDVRLLELMGKQVDHDMHQMQAFVRFREVEGRYIAWYAPDHHIVKRIAPWFANRFGSMRWSILTPDACAHFDLQNITFSQGVPRSEAPTADALEDLWRAYYASTFNPARLNLSQMRTHMPERRWTTMPELQVLNNLVRSAGDREQLMLGVASGNASHWVPENATLPNLRQAIHSCRGCELWECATQPVFGEGPADARLVCVGEQPGDNEDRQGRPFVGPAGQLFDRALIDAGLRREELYLTGAVKHFRFEQRGKVRIHKTASKAQIASCQPWLEAELRALRPRIILCMGNTAVLSVIGRGIRLGEERGRVLPHRLADGALITVHPSFLLRMPDEARRQTEYQRFVADLRTAAAFASAA